ncbi:MAG: GIY-YIG nuclease family protein [Candidatus Pacebacteria bacterium]|nr:GIY-YIG nuclease family protein [Candidatus Paceibacterota bacterium]
MHYVYATRSNEKNYIYVGLTNCVERRFNEHNLGYVRKTKYYSPFTLIYSEECKTRNSARKREKYLKRGFGREFLKSL